VRIPIKATAREPIKQAGYISATSAIHAQALLRNAAGPYKKCQEETSVAVADENTFVGECSTDKQVSVLQQGRDAAVRMSKNKRGRGRRNMAPGRRFPCKLLIFNPSGPVSYFIALCRNTALLDPNRLTRLRMSQVRWGLIKRRGFFPSQGAHSISSPLGLRHSSVMRTSIALPPATGAARCNDAVSNTSCLSPTASLKRPSACVAMPRSYHTATSGMVGEQPAELWSGARLVQRLSPPDEKQADSHEIHEGRLVPKK
jgi:hypothetical protein